MSVHRKQGFLWLSGRKPEGGFAMFRWIRIRFFRIITALTLQLAKLVAIREFRSLTEEDVEYLLVAWKDSLRFAYENRDRARMNVCRVSSLPYSESYESDCRVELMSLKRANDSIADRQRKYDFSRGLAYLMGFGKIVDKVSKR